MGRRDKRRARARREASTPTGDGQQAAVSGQPEPQTPAAPHPGAPAKERSGVPRRHTVVIPRSAGLASWVAVAALTRHPFWKDVVEPGAAVIRAALGGHWTRDLPSPDGEPGEPLGQRLERRGYLLLGVGDGTGAFEDRGPDAILDQLCSVMAAGFSDPSVWVKGDPTRRVAGYPDVPATPAMVLRALWLLADRGLVPETQVQETSRELGALLFERMVSGGVSRPETANLEALTAWQRQCRKPWTLGKSVLRAIVATDGWYRLAAADWEATGRTVTAALPDASGTVGAVRVALCRSRSPLAAEWIRGRVPADIVVRVEDGGFFAQVVDRKGAVRERLSAAAVRWRRAFLTRPISEQQAADAGKPGLLAWSPVYLDVHGACAANCHEGDPYLERLPLAAAEIEQRLVQALEMG